MQSHYCSSPPKWAQVVKYRSLLEPFQVHTGVLCSSKIRVGGQMVDGQRGGVNQAWTVLKNAKATLNRVINICLRLEVFGVLLLARVGTPVPPEVQNASLELQTRWKRYLKRESVCEVVALKARESEGAWCGATLITADVWAKWKKLQMSASVLSLLFFSLLLTRKKQNSISRAAPIWSLSVPLTSLKALS